MEKVAVLVSLSAMISRGGFTTSTEFPSALPVLKEEIARNERRNDAKNNARDILCKVVMM